MTAPGNTESEQEVRPTETIQRIRWSPEDWARVVQIAEKLSQDNRIDVNPTDAVRSGIRRLHEDMFGTAA
jgi:hypothetical protein